MISDQIALHSVQLPLYIVLRCLGCLLRSLTILLLLVVVKILSLSFKGTHNKYRNLFISTNLVFIKWRCLCKKVGAETTRLWACVLQLESMNGLLVEQDCFGLNQVTFRCVLVLQQTMYFAR